MATILLIIQSSSQHEPWVGYRTTLSLLPLQRINHFARESLTCLVPVLFTRSNPQPIWVVFQHS
jgi:hypothetical protein